MRSSTSLLLVSTLLFLIIVDVIPILAKGETKVHIVYMGRKQHDDDAELTTKIHHETLASILGSQEAAAESIIYSYRHGFSGFAAKLTKSQAQKIAGIWPESASFSDKGLGPIPSKWKGHCEAGKLFNPATACNKKVIGAKYFIKGVEAELGRKLANDTEFLSSELMSPRDMQGHGTHTSSTAAGSFAPNASYKGLGFGTARGGAPGLG
nr:Subtilisin-like protease SBT3.5 [Ipomoea batatas]